MRLVAAALAPTLLVLGALVGAGASAQDVSTPQGIPREIQPQDAAQVELTPRAARGLLVRVVNYAGPLEGADITLSHTTTEKTVKGRSGPEGLALIDVKGRGRWQIEVVAPEHRAAHGVIDIPARTEIEIDLPHERERQRGGGERLTQEQVAAMLRAGEEAIAAGDHEGGRATLRRAAARLAPAGKAEVMTLIARSYWVEGQRDRSVVELERAIRVDPSAATPRQVFKALMEALGRTEEVSARLLELEQDSQSSPSVAPASSAEKIPVIAAATPELRGDARVRLRDAHPLAAPEVLLRRMQPPEDHRSSVQAIDLSRESFEVFVPPNSTTGSGEESEQWGLFVWISPTDQGGPPNDAVRDVLSQHGLIWVGANDAGNQRSYFQRLALALHAASGASATWSVDPERVVIAGYSGGGRTASMAAWQWPEVFTGAVFWMGADFYESIEVPHAPGNAWGARFPKPKRSQLRQIKRERPFAYVTGDFDFNRSETKAIHRRTQQQGFDRFLYLQISEADHYVGLVPDVLDQALEHLGL